jgi:hypothetical protein
MSRDAETPDPVALLAAARTELARTPSVVTGLVDGLDETGWTARPVPGEWSAVEIVCHLRDEETEDFGARVRAVIAGETRFARIDPEAWATERRYLDEPLAPVLADLRARRAATLDYLAGLDAGRLRQAVPLRGGGSLSGLDLVVAWVAHDRLHLTQLAATLARTWANCWSPLLAAYAGPIPYEPPPPAS